MEQRAIGRIDTFSLLILSGYYSKPKVNTLEFLTKWRRQTESNAKYSEFASVGNPFSSCNAR